MAKVSNRRIRKRLPLTQKVKHTQYQAAGTPVFQESSAIDVSSRGISFETKRLYQKGDLIFLEVQIGEERVRLLVCVAWVKKSKKAETYEVGAELMGIDPAHQRKMQNSLEKLNRKPKARPAARARKTNKKRK